MAEEAKEGGKKKGGKMPIILALVVLLGGGGFFMMKGKGGDEGPPEPVPGKIEVMEELVADMADGSFVKAKVALQFDKNYAGTGFKDNQPLIAQTINDSLRFRTRRDVRTPAGMQKLRRELAEKINKLLKEPEEKKSTTRRKKSDKDEEEEVEYEIPEGWDHAEGPVLRVIFQSFATQ